MRKDKSFVKARSRGVDLGSQLTDLQGERDSGGRERKRHGEK